MTQLYRLSLIILLGLSASFGLRAQFGDIPTDTICEPFVAGQFITNLFADDGIFVGEGLFVQYEGQSECFRIDRRGNLFFSDLDADRCCGEYDFFVNLFEGDPATGQSILIAQQRVLLTIKCPKPDCGLVDLDALHRSEPGTNPDIPNAPHCLAACENSTATYLFAESPGLTYDWQVTNGAVDPTPALPNQVTVSWGSLGPADLTVDIYDANGNLLETRNFCVTLTEAPIADFTFANVACLGQEVYFFNTSSGAPATYDWGFGDGNTAQNTTNPVRPNAAHAYTTPGTYTVTLYATSDGGFNPDGSQACCCTDSISYDIVIDPLPGPGIFWVSTLCEGDTSKYWTDATNCGTVAWTVSANGDPQTPLTGDTIVVVWNNGPSGTLTLAVTGCDIDYCDAPAVAIVPIISSNSDIAGATEVCRGESASYQLPKWTTTTYNWSVPPGATVNGSSTGHTANITWPTTPGDYEITVTYGSDFLAGLPGHEGDDCTGEAFLTVTVLGDFSLTATPSPACLDGSTTFNGNSDISGSDLYDWSVIGHPALDQAALASYTVNWSALPGPGVYTIQASITDPENYCTDTRTISVVVKDATDPAISGPTEYCVGDELVFSVTSPAPGYNYNWIINPAVGNLVSANGGPTVTVVFTATTGATISVQGTDGAAPNCQSAVISTPLLTTIGFDVPVTIIGDNACMNSLATYTLDVPQHPDAEYEWVVFPPEAGSVVNGAATGTVEVQWNNLAGPGPFPVSVDLTMTLCGQQLLRSLPLSLNPPTVPVIIQQGSLCPGGSAQLYVDSLLFDAISWDLGGNAGTVIGVKPGLIAVFEPGNYVVNTVDLNGCPGVARYRVEETNSPSVTISTPDDRSICVTRMPFPPNPVLTAATAAANSIEWFCNGVSQGVGSVGNTTFTHVWTTTPGIFAYIARVTDPNGCVGESKPIYIRQNLCCGPPYVTDPLPQHTFTLTQQTPNCDVVDLVATFGPDTVVTNGFSWFFDDAQILSSGGNTTTAVDSMTLRLPGIGNYTIFHGITVWAYDYDTTFIVDAAGNLIIDEIFKADSILCGKTLSQQVDVPIFADFDERETCGRVDFTNLTQFLGGSAPAGTSYSWLFGDPASGSSSLSDPSYTYAANGSYTVTLTVSDGSCESTSTRTVDVTDLPEAAFTVAPNPVCYGEPITFTGTGTNVISWAWDFDDGSMFVGNGPQRTFLPVGGSGTFDVQLITENRAGCRDTVVNTITVFPVPAEDLIDASNGLIICEGESTTLSVNNVAGLNYLWSTGATTSSIVVTTAGTYDVTLTTADGCVTTVAPVEVQLIPLPDASWKGNPFICGNGSTTLMAFAGGGHTITWENQASGAIFGGASYTVTFNPAFPVQIITLRVVNNAYGCVAESTFEVFQVASPAPAAAITAGDACEGTGTTISVINVDPDLLYTWNTGATGTSIFTYAAGTYTVIATDPLSGCSGSDQVTINPLPDLCIVPSGCYETCRPDTLPGPTPPAGTTYAYEWLKDGFAFPGNNVQNLPVTMSGTYTLTVVNLTTFCMATSGELLLEVIDCDPEPCDDITTRLLSVGQDDEKGCCFELFYDNVPADVYLIQISSPDATLSIAPGSANPAFGFSQNAGLSVIGLAVTAPLSVPVPSNMTTTGAVTFCPDDYTSVPQTIIVDYLGEDGLAVICSDTLFTDCEPEPDCAYVTQDSLFCDEDGNLVFTFTICNPTDALFDIGFLELIPASSAATTALPPGSGLTVSPAMLPGECRTFTLNLPDLPAGGTFAYTLLAHSANPITNPEALCCSDPSSTRKLEIPDCDPCDNLSVIKVESDEESCCHRIVVDNQAASFGINGIGICLIDSDATLNVYSSAIDPLIGVVTSPTTATITMADGSDLPAGAISLPTICLADSEQPVHQIEIKYLVDGEVVCRDTVEVFCTPPCGFLTEKEIDCKAGFYVWSGQITNTSSFVMSEAYIAFDPASGLSGSNQNIVFGSPLPPGATTSIQIAIGSPAGPGDTICFTVIFHETGPDDFHLNCCAFDVCVVMPDCRIEACICESDQALREEISVGIDTMRLPLPGLAYRFSPVYEVSGCDELTWEVRRLNPTTNFLLISTDYVADYTFERTGRYQIRLRVTRTGDDGKVCTATTFRTFVIGNGDSVSGGDPPTRVEVTPDDVILFPNPAQREINLSLAGKLLTSGQQIVTLQDLNGRGIRTYSLTATTPGTSQVFQLNVAALPEGIYLLRGTDGWAKKVVIRR
jgi:PKD repeat protein